jgi:protein-tyrosine-phosphatase
LAGKDIFLSYARKDRSRVLLLVHALESMGWAVFWDTDGIRTGDAWRDTLEKEVAKARSMVVVWSKASVKSAFVKDEAQRGMKRSVLFPVRIDAVKPPLGFGGTQCCDLVGWDGTAAAPSFRRLAEDLSRLLGRPRLTHADAAGPSAPAKAEPGPGKTLVFLSAGGTGRDPMAKAIAGKLLEDRTLKHPVDIRAVGLGRVSSTKAEYAARYVINEMYGEDLLKEHRPAQLTPELAKRADLILVMDRSLLNPKILPSGKSYVLKEFFGVTGDVDVVDPFPDGRDDATLARYRACAKELRHLLEQGLDRLIDALSI